MPIVVPSAPAFTECDARVAIAEMIKAAAPNATVEHSWVLKTDLTGGVSALLGKNADASKVHAWMIGVESFDFIKNSNGDPPVIGGQQIDWLYSLAVWGFFDYFLGTDTADSAKIVGAETELVAATIFANKWLGLDNPNGLREVKPLAFTSIDVHSFGDGQDVHVAQGTMQIRIMRTI